MRNKAKADDMPTDDKPALVPKLRFPEFRVAPSWKKMRLGHNLKFQPGFPFASSGFNDAGRGPRLIRNRDLRSDDIIVFYSDTFDESFVVNDGDVLVGMDGDFTPTIWTKGKALLNQRVGRVYPRADNDRRFLYYLLTLCLKKIEEETARTTVKHLSHSALEERYEPLASPAEQLKIAECLSSLDEAITAQARKVDALTKHKKGLMQQLFPREGETHPRLRFPEFREAGEWVTTSLGQIASYENGKAYEQDIVENGRYLVVNSRFISTDGTVRKYTNADYLIAKVGEVLMVLSDLPKGKALAKCFFVEADDRYAVNQRICRLKPTRIDGKFLYYILNRHPRLLAYDDGLNQTHLSKGSVTECPLCIPSEKAEQQRIASCLSSLDHLIAAGSRKLYMLKTHKKGMMQQLFPSALEVEA